MALVWVSKGIETSEFWKDHHHLFTSMEKISEGEVDIIDLYPEKAKISPHSLELKTENCSLYRLQAPELPAEDVFVTVWFERKPDDSVSIQKYELEYASED